MYYEKYRHLLKKIQDTKNIGHRTMIPQSPSKQAPWDLTRFSQTPSAAHHIFLNLIRGLKSLPFQRRFQFWEKPEVAGCQIWAAGRLSHLGDFMFHQKTLHETGCMSRCIVMMKLPITSCPSAVAFCIIQIVSREECSSLTQNLIQICCSTCSVILNVMASQYT